jgi:hypothetical protein
MERSEGIVLLLPEDALAEIFRRLPPHSLAVLRCVCGAWRAFIDARRLLRKELPHFLASFLVNFHLLKSLQLLSHPSAASNAADLDLTVSGKLDHVYPLPSVHVMDHCNGLVLIHDTVANPATRRSARLPSLPPSCLDRSPHRHFYANRYIAFDPAVSPHYEVLSVRRILYKQMPWHLDPAIEALEWPPSPCAMHIFSSRTGRWEETSFVREGDAAGTVADMRGDSIPRKRNAVYWQNKLYVLCETNILMR